MICAQPRGFTIIFHLICSQIFFTFHKVPISAVAYCSVSDCVVRSKINNSGWWPDNCRLARVQPWQLLSSGNIHLGDWIWLLTLVGGKKYIQLRVQAHYIQPCRKATPYLSLYSDITISARVFVHQTTNLTCRGGKFPDHSLPGKTSKCGRC